MKRSRWLTALGLVLSAMGAAGCLGDNDAEAPTGPGGNGAGGPVPDFALEDVNSTSPHFGTRISPRDFLDQVSAWYFGHAN